MMARNGDRKVQTTVLEDVTVKVLFPGLPEMWKHRSL